MPLDALDPPTLVTQLLTHPGQIQEGQAGAETGSPRMGIEADAQSHLARLQDQLAAIEAARRSVKSQIRGAKRQLRGVRGR